MSQSVSTGAVSWSTPVQLQGLPANERIWREIPRRESGTGGSQVVIGHWTDSRVEHRELVAPVFDRYFTVSILLGKATVDCYKNGKLSGRGTGGVGGLQLTAPGERIQCGFRGANESIHIFFPSDLIELECGEERHSVAARLFDDPAFRVDPVLGPLAQPLAAAHGEEGRIDVAYVEGQVYAILGHVLSRYGRESKTDMPVGGGLSSARLRRTLDYMEAYLAEPITLQDIAQQAGLSRMHFAAQFRLATGTTPHAFLLNRRIERAKTLLERDMPIVQVALAVGFQAQAHFTTAFRGASGTTPARWRAQQQQARR